MRGGSECARLEVEHEDVVDVLAGELLEAVMGLVVLDVVVALGEGAEREDEGVLRGCGQGVWSAGCESAEEDEVGERRRREERTS